MLFSLQGPPPPPGGPLPLLGTTGTELLQFGMLVLIGVWFARRERRNAPAFVRNALVLVSLFYLLCPEDSAFQRRAGDALMSGMAAVQAGLMQLGGWNVEAQGPAVVGSIRFTYARGCMGLSYLAMGLLCLASHPAAWSRRWAGLVVMASGMLCMNLLRLILLYQLWAGGFYREYELCHRVGGGLFAVAAALLYAAVLAVRPAEDPLPLPARQAAAL